ncbi:MAG: hypothetical protein JXQ30_15160 [Spirochaetes bacterium]|nr:hypothetical protein [Spirochaetota bacterium]
MFIKRLSAVYCITPIGEYIVGAWSSLHGGPGWGRTAYTGGEGGYSRRWLYCSYPRARQPFLETIELGLENAISHGLVNALEYEDAQITLKDSRVSCLTYIYDCRMSLPAASWTRSAPLAYRAVFVDTGVGHRIFYICGR